MRAATTEILIEDLVLQLSVRRRATPVSVLILLAGAAALAGVLVFFGYRPHFVFDLVRAQFLFKETYVTALAGAVIWLALRSGRPGVTLKPTLGLLATVLAVGVMVSVGDLAMMAADQRPTALFGETWRVCARNIVALSIIPAPIFVYTLRRMAPTGLRVTGAAVGASAGAVAASVYGLLFCPELSPAFVVTWYTLGVVIVALIGAALGRQALRW